MQKNTSSTLVPQNHITAIQVIQQLQQNQALRMEVFKLKTTLKSQHINFQSSIISQQMITQKIVTSLKMAIKSCLSSKGQQPIQQSNEFLCNIIQQSLFDLENLLQLCADAKIESEREKTDLQLLSHSESTKSYKVKKSNKGGQSLEEIQKRHNLTVQRYEAQLKQNDELKRKLLQSYEQIKAIRSNNLKLQNTINEFCQKLKSKQNDLQRFENENDRLMAKINENQQISRTHVDYFKRKAEEIQIQNEKVVMLHRDAVYREKELIKIAEDAELEAKKILQERNRLKVQLQTSQFKLDDIIQKQQKIRSLENIIRGNGQQQKSLRDIKNKLGSIQLLDSKQTLKMSKRFNLQHFQYKLSNSTTSLVY